MSIISSVWSEVLQCIWIESILVPFSMRFMNVQKSDINFNYRYYYIFGIRIAKIQYLRKSQL